VGVPDAGQVGHDREVVLPVHVDDQLGGQVPGAAPGPVGDRHEAGVAGRQFGDGLLQVVDADGGLGREELEGDRPALRQEVRDLRHGRPRLPAALRTAAERSGAAHRARSIDGAGVAERSEATQG